MLPSQIMRSGKVIKLSVAMSESQYRLIKAEADRMVIPFSTCLRLVLSGEIKIGGLNG